MPNWCTNTTYVDGPWFDVELLQNLTTGACENDHEIILSDAIPMPDILKGTTSPAPTSPNLSEEEERRWIESIANGTATKDAYDAFVQDLKDDFAKAEAAEARTGHRCWYSWQSANWGIKWGDCHGRYEFIDNQRKQNGTTGLVIHYDTPWGPFAEQFWEKISQTFSRLRFITRYHEEGMGFMGVIAVQNGQVIHHTEMRIPDPDAMFSRAPGGAEDIHEDDRWDYIQNYIDERLDTLVEAVRAENPVEAAWTL